MVDVYFVHVVNDLLHMDLPEHLHHRPPDEELEASIETKLSKYFPKPSFRVHIEVHEGNVFDKVLRLSRIKETDLLVFGVKSRSEGSGLCSQRLLRSASCSTLLVPAKSAYSFKKLACAIDFSEHSMMVAETVSGLAKGVSELEFIHLYKNSFHYLKVAESAREAAANIKSHSLEKWEDFAEKLRLPIDSLTLLPSNVDTSLLSHCVENNIDLLVLGSKGQTASVSNLIGSFTEKIASQVSSTPILIVRKKGENYDLVRLLLDFAEN
jgi:nucleotide-binding universal stress UspA family protein